MPEHDLESLPEAPRTVAPQGHLAGAAPAVGAPANTEHSGTESAGADTDDVNGGGTPDPAGDESNPEAQG